MSAQAVQADAMDAEAAFAGGNAGGNAGGSAGGDDDFTADLVGTLEEEDDEDDDAARERISKITFCGPVKLLPAFEPIKSGDAAAIIVLSHTGGTARFISSYRPRCPVFVVSRDLTTIRQSHLMRGNMPLLYPGDDRDYTQQSFQWEELMNNQVHWAISHGVKQAILKEGDTVVVVLHGWRSA